MNTEQARAAVADALATIAPEAELSDVDPEARFRDELDLDSMDFLALVQALHDSTGVDIPEADYRQVDTLDGLIGYLAAAV
ncbi:MAG: acyl carrier protein [Mycobacteriales bacterium]